METKTGEKVPLLPQPGVFQSVEPEIPSWRDRPLASVLEEGAGQLGWPLSAVERDACLLYLDLLLERNRQMNLTALRDPHEALVKHFLDSMTLLPFLPQKKGLRLADVGTGAGFPGVVLKIFRPDLRLCLIDSVRKRLGFLENLSEALKLAEVETVHARAEEIGRQKPYRERFDLVTARAVAELRTLAEYGLPLTKVGGIFLVMKGPKGREEWEAARPAIQTLGGALVEERQLQLPFVEEARHLFALRKDRSTPALYPRRSALIQSQPL